jgi:sulfur-carrier protein adenylyltransferase/sulfurtransferase
MLTTKESQRYSRHLLLSEIGTAGQLRLKASSVLVVGAGGLGCPVLQYLVAAGVGTIGIMDFDQVSLSNLQRQVLYTEADIGKNKAEVAKEKLQSQNADITILAYLERLEATNIAALFEKYDFIVDCTDNFATRYLINDACVLLDKPLIYGSIHRFQGQVTLFNATLGDRRGPTLRCLYPVSPDSQTSLDCAAIGVLGVLPGLIGTLQATEVIKLICGIGHSLSGRLLLFDALTMQTMQVEIARNPAVEAQMPATLEDLTTWRYQGDCSQTWSENSITYAQLSELLLQESVLCIDVRAHDEGTLLQGAEAIRIPVAELLHRKLEIDSTRKIVLYCASGKRSTQAIEILAPYFTTTALFELRDGLSAYSELQTYL